MKKMVIMILVVLSTVGMLTGCEFEASNDDGKLEISIDMQDEHDTLDDIVGEVQDFIDDIDVNW